MIWCPPVTPPFRRIVVLSVAAFGFALAWGCSYQPTRKWMGPALTAETYGVASSGETPRQQYLSAKSAQSGIPVQQVVAADEALSDAINPYSYKDSGAVESGKVIFAAHCAQCHGVEADGSGPPPFGGLKKMNFHNSHKRMFVQMNGRAPANWFSNSYNGMKSSESDDAVMPPQKQKLAREQIWLAITYLEHVSATK